MHRLLIYCLCFGASFTITHTIRTAFFDRDAKLAIQAPEDCSGYYSVAGEDGADGGEVKSYTGLACVSKFKGRIYHVSTQVGLTNTKGVGLLKDGVLAIGWTAADGKVIGCSLYQKQGNDLLGTWCSIPGSGVARKEKLTFRARLDETEEPPLATKTECCCGPDCACKPCDCPCKK